ncbi:choice-of-anchor L domain-containing protein, partial [Flavobacterium sp.]|uniref:choice-of-anchor L domain-containing protein n=1 Tax=Flavobacterium sp. TaxID=239 RepID=UPI002634BF46
MKKITLLLTFLFFSTVALSQVETFEGGIPSTWAVMNGANGVGALQPWILNTSNWPLPTSPRSPYAAHNDPTTVLNAAYVNNEQIGMGNTEEDWLITDQKQIPVNGQLRFWTRLTTVGDQGTIYEIRVSTNATQTNQAAYTVLQSWGEDEIIDPTQPLADYQEVKVDFPAALQGQNVYIAFVRVFTQPSGARAGDRWLIDDVNLVQKCLEPVGLEVIPTSISSTSVTFTWNNPGLATDFEYEIVPASQEPTGTGTPLVINPAQATINFTAGGLLPDVTYKFYVRAICGPGNSSEPVGPTIVTTVPLGSVCSDPLVVNALPYQTTGNTATYGDDIDTPQGTLCGATPVGTNYLAGNEVFYSYTATDNGIISVTMTPLGNTSTNSSVFVYEGCSNVGVTCFAGAASANTNVRSFNINVTAGQQYVIVISSGPTTPSITYNLLIQKEDCTPKPGGLGADGATLNSAHLFWDNPGNNTSWQVAVQPLGSTVPTGPGDDIVTGNPEFVKTGLNPATQYQYWVRVECGAGSGVFSAWAGPFPFNTLICDPSQTCDYTFRLSNTTANGWGATRMQVRQNGIVVATLGATATGTGPTNVTVPLCNNVPFDLFWSVAGTTPQQRIVAIINKFGQTIYTKPAGTGTVGSILYSDVVNCDTPRCDLTPTGLGANNVLTNTADLFWDAPATTSWDVYLVTQGSTAPIGTTTPTYNDISTNPYGVSGLTPDTAYEFYVRVNCPSGDSAWAGPFLFTTLPTCPKPTTLGVSGITTTEALLTWINGTPTDNLWEILLLPGPTAPAPPAPSPADPTVPPGGFFFQTTNSQAHLISTLEPATIYYYYIRTICAGNDKSTWSGPIIFNTITCDAADKCVYKFIMTDAGTNGWNGARMQVRQNGIIIQTIGQTIAGGGPTTVNVSLCNNVPFDLYWSVPGTAPAEVGVSIQNPFTDIVFTKAPGTGTPLTVLYADNVLGNCVPPTCPKPTALDVNIAQTTQNSVELTWTESGSAIKWEVYAVPVIGATPPVNGSPLNGTGSYHIVTELPYTLTGLLPSTTYIYYVRAVCSDTDISTWTILNPKTFTTKPVNDECEFATPVPVNPTRDCALSANGTTLGATRSLPNTAPVCPGNTDDDVWFSFQATSTIHIITISDIIATAPASADLNHTLYSGNDCTALTQMYCSNPDVSIATNLVIGNFYKIRVYTNGGNAAQSASFRICITTPPPVTNDECATATTAVVNNGIECVSSTPGSITGATASPQTSTCAGAEDDDIWFEFTCNSPTQIINLNNIVGTTTNLVHALYHGDVCGTMDFLYCSDPEESIAENLVVGDKYKIRVWTNVNTLQDVTFDLCIGRILPPITTNTTQYTVEQLVQDVFLGSDCALVSNITWSTGSDFGSTNGIGYFNKSLSDFEYDYGIVLSTGNANSVPGPNDSTLSDGTYDWPGDAELETATNMDAPSHNATILEFDFIPYGDELNFKYKFASEEYGDFQCQYSDAFAFLLTDTSTNITTNIAVLGDGTPVSVTNVRDELYNDNCTSEHAGDFETYYGDNGVNPIGAPINYDGITVNLNAHADVTPGTLYHIKLVIGDRQDNSYDSVVFLKGGSLDIGNVELGEDFLEANGNAVCLGDEVTIASGLDPDDYDFEWYLGDALIPNENNPTLTVVAQGVYTVKATYSNTTCVASDSVTVEYFQDAVAGTPANLIDCNASGTSTFDLTQNTASILAPFAPGTHDVHYFLTPEDAEDNVLANEITDLTNFIGTNGQTIYVRVNKLSTTCHQVVSFGIVVQDLTPQFNLSGTTEICPEASTTITVQPLAGNFDPALVTYTWYFNNIAIPGQTGQSLLIDLTSPDYDYGTYSVTVNNSGCTANQVFVIENSNTVWDFDVTGPATLCSEGNGALVVTVNNNTNNSPVTYTYTLPDSSVVTSSNNTLPVTGANIGNYSVTVDILGCTSGPETFAIGAGTGNYAVTFENTPYTICQNQSVTLSFVGTNFDINDPTAVYTWT